MNQRPETMAEDDVIGLSLRQHQEVRPLFAQTEKGKGIEREDTVDRLRHLLAVHETAEEEIAHPQARRRLDGDQVVDARLEEDPYAAMLDRSRDVVRAALRHLAR